MIHRPENPPEWKDVSTLLPYKANRPCAKCGNKKARTDYRSIRNIMLRTCVNCGNVWEELPLDTKGGE